MSISFFPRLFVYKNLLILVSIASTLRAATVAEWRFDAGNDLAGSEVVKLDVAKEGASDESIIQAPSMVTSQPTGLGDKWTAFLRTGYLEAQSSSNLEASFGKDGLVTQAKPSGTKNYFYSAYFGFSGLGSGADAEGRPRGGTICLVMSPTQNFKPGCKYGLAGCGVAGDGEFQLNISKAGQLMLYVGGKVVGLCTNRATVDWKPDTWYFIAGSWHTGEETLLYIREMDPAGVAPSPAGIWGTPEGTVPTTARPGDDPLVIGANWYNPGDRSATVLGAGSKIAFARFDNTFSSKEEIEEMFKSLGSP